MISFVETFKDRIFVIKICLSKLVISVYLIQRSFRNWILLNLSSFIRLLKNLCLCMLRWSMNRGRMSKLWGWGNQLMLLMMFVNLSGRWLLSSLRWMMRMLWWYNWLLWWCRWFSTWLLNSFSSCYFMSMLRDLHTWLL